MIKGFPIISSFILTHFSQYLMFPEPIVIVTWFEEKNDSDNIRSFERDPFRIKLIQFIVNDLNLEYKFYHKV